MTTHLHALPPATCYFRANAVVRFPVELSAGDYLAIMPPEYPENMWVHEPVGLWVVRRRYFPEAKLWTVLDDLMYDERVSLLYSPLQIAWALRSRDLEHGPHPALQLMR